MSNYRLIVRRIDNNEQVGKPVKLASGTPNYVERVMRGMLINMGDDFYIDDSEAYEDKEE